MERWVGRVAVVTGASAGIGLAIAKALVQKGMIVVGLARRREMMESEMANIPRAKGKFYALKADVANDEEVVKAFEWIKHNVGSVQVLINNAGVAAHGKFSEVDNAILKNTMEINVMGTIYCTKQTLKVLQSNNLEGHIINMNSIMGHKVVRVMGNDMNAYNASKHAITGFSEALVRELMGQNIRVTSLSPGVVRTEIVEKIGNVEVLKEPFLECQDIADAIVYLLGTPQRVQVKELMISPLGEKLL